MSVEVQPGPDPENIQLTFTVPDDLHDGPISVVGSFNQWTPGVDNLQAQPDGTRSVTITVPADRDIHFRYLGSGGVWFNDPNAPSTGEGSVLPADEVRRRASEANPKPATIDSAGQPD